MVDLLHPVTTQCKVEKWEADSGDVRDAQTCVRTLAFMFSLLFSQVSDNCHRIPRPAQKGKAVTCVLSDHPKPANEYHLKTGQREQRLGH